MRAVYTSTASVAGDKKRMHPQGPFLEKYFTLLHLSCRPADIKVENKRTTPHVVK